METKSRTNKSSSESNGGSSSVPLIDEMEVNVVSLLVFHYQDHNGCKIKLQNTVYGFVSLFFLPLNETDTAQRSSIGAFVIMTVDRGVNEMA